MPPVRAAVLAGSPALSLAFAFVAIGLIGCEADTTLRTGDQLDPGADSALHTASRGMPLIKTTVLYAGDSIALPTEVALIDSSVLLVVDPYLPGIHVLDALSGAILNSIGREGKGPGEFTFPSGAALVQGGDIVLVGDPGAGRVLSLSTDSLLAGRPPFLGQAKLTIPYRQLLATSDGRVLASDLSGSTRFLLLSADGQLTSRVGAGVGAESSLPAEVAGRAYAQVLAVHPREPRASGAVRGGALAIFDLGGLLVDSAAVPTVFEPRVEVGSAPDGRPVMRLGAETRFGYVGMAATCSFVVGLFSGRRLLDHSREASAGDQIHLFDWKGRLLETYALDRGIRGIVADEATGKVYATYWGTHPAIVEFQLPALVADTIRGRCT